MGHNNEKKIILGKITQKKLGGRQFWSNYGPELYQIKSRIHS